MYNSQTQRKSIRDSIHYSEFLTHLPFYILIAGSMWAGITEFNKLSRKIDELDRAQEQRLEATLVKNNYHSASTNR